MLSMGLTLTLDDFKQVSALANSFCSPNVSVFLMFEDAQQDLANGLYVEWDL